MNLTSTLTAAALAPKRYIAWNTKTGMYFGNDGLGFNQIDKNFTPKLSETELLVIKFQWNNIAWAKA